MPLREQVAEAKSLLEDLSLSIGAPGVSLKERKATWQHEEKMGLIQQMAEQAKAR